MTIVDKIPFPTLIDDHPLRSFKHFRLFLLLRAREPPRVVEGLDGGQAGQHAQRRTLSS